MIYQDFDLLIDRHGGTLRAQVLNSPAGQATAEFCLPFSDDKLENFLLRLGRARRLTRRVESQEMNTAKTFGASLFDAVFTGDVKACFRSSIDEARRQNAGLRIRLRLGDPSVIDLPWEFLYNRSVNRFIALSVHTPLVRYMDLPERIQPISVKPPIRVLVMISSPTDFPALDVEEEWTRLNESLKDRVAAGQLAIDRLGTASLEALQRKLRRETYHIFHFIGHGEFDQELQEGVLILEGENKRGHKVDGQYLGMLLHDHESLRVAILNACEGARTSRTDPFAGSAQSLVQQGIPAVIAMQFEIADDVASRFAHEFYGALADGYPIDASLTEARKSIFAAGREVEWGTPVLYLRAPDGRIFDIENARPQPIGPVDRGLKKIDSSNQAVSDRLAHEVVAAAQSTFAAGQRLQAIEMLGRFGSESGEIGDALRELTLEHQRLIDEGHRIAREKLDKHLRTAGTLLASGHLTEAWGEACDALHADPADKRAIALEGRIRKVLDDKAARDFAREQEEHAARRADAERTRQMERSDALTRSRLAVENFMACGDLDRAEEELNRIGESNNAGAELADLRAHVLDRRRHRALQQDRHADQVIAQARQQFPEAPAAAVELLERFSPPHARVTAALRELRDGIAEQNERAIREAERRSEEARERQRNKQEVVERRRQRDDAARAAIVHGQNLAAAGDVAGAVRQLEKFGPGHPEVAAALEALRRQHNRISRPWSAVRLRPIVSLAAQPRLLLAVAVVVILVAAAVWLMPRAIGRFTSRPATPGTSQAGGERGRPPSPGATGLRGAASPPVPSLAPASSETVGASAGPAGGVATEATGEPAVSSGTPAGARTEAPVVRPEATVIPTTSAAGAPPPPEEPALSSAQLVAESRKRIQAHLTKLETEQALLVLTGALANGPRDQSLRSIGSKIVEQAQDRAVREHSRALAQGASGLAKFKQAESAAERARSLSRQGNVAASARAYLDAASLFASCVTAAASVVHAGPVPRAVEPPANAAGPASPISSPAAGPPATPASSDPSRGRSPAGQLMVDPVIAAYAAAVTRGDRAALLAVYPTAPADVLAALGNKGPGIDSYNMRIAIIRVVSDASTRAHVSVTVIHEFITRSGPREREEKQIFELERKGDSWVLVEIRPQ